MRICIISPTPITDKEEGWGGVHTHTEMVCNIITKLGHAVTLLTTSHPKGLSEEWYNGIHIVYIREVGSAFVSGKDFRRVKEAFLNLHLQSPFHCVFSEGNSACMLKKYKTARNLPLIYIVHIPGFTHFYNIWNEVCGVRTLIYYLLKTVPKILYRVIFWEKPLARFSTKILSPSALKAKQLCKFYNVSPEKVEILSNWVDTEIFKPDNKKKSNSRKNWLVSENELVFLVSGGIWRPKGFHIAIQSFSNIVRSFSNSVLLICGAGMEKEEKFLTNLVQKEKLENRIRFLGKFKLSELPLIYNMADIFLMPSLMSEGHAYSLIEAMACGLPCIATKLGGNIETIGDSGILVPPGDVNALEQAMIELAQSPERRRELSQLARERVVRYFSEAVAVQKISKLIEEAIK